MKENIGWKKKDFKIKEKEEWKLEKKKKKSSKKGKKSCNDQKGIAKLEKKNIQTV